MSSVLRSVRKRKKGRTLGAVDVIDRAEYAELEVDAKVELIRSSRPGTARAHFAYCHSSGLMISYQKLI